MDRGRRQNNRRRRNQNRPPPGPQQGTPKTSSPKRPTPSQGESSSSSSKRPNTLPSNPSLPKRPTSSQGDRPSLPKRPTPSKGRPTSGPKRPGPTPPIPADRSLDRGETRARALQRFRKLAWELEIRGIERVEGPLKDPATSPITQVTIAPPPPPRGSGVGSAPTDNDVVVLLDGDDDDNASLGRAAKAPAKTGAKVVVVLDDDDDDDNNAATPTVSKVPASSNPPQPDMPPRATDPPEFYLGGSVTAARTNRLLRHQQRSVNPGRYPSPQAGIRFDLASLRRDLAGGQAALLLPTQESVSEEYRRQTFHGQPPLAFDKAITTNWLREAGTLYKGFPMVEKTVFFAANNFAGLRSNCFFKAVAYQVYGGRAFDARVKAEHLQYFSDVLKWPTHPRHEMYTRLNEWFYESYVSRPQGQAGDGGSRASIELAANFYQLLTIPNCYIPMDMFEVTADLYNLFIVIYTLGENGVVTEMTTKGSYNARHVFMLYSAKHFQPMVPNDYYASEFQLPRITHYSTLNYPLTRARDKDAHTVDHVYRKRCRITVDRKPGAPPVDVVFYKKTIEAVVNGKQLI